MQEVCRLLQVKKLNTSGYHPQTDGLVEKFNSTLIEMIAKCASDKPLDWDTRLPYLLFAYRSSAQESTRESPFYLVYGRDPRIPTSTVLSQKQSVYSVDLNDYKSEFVCNLSQAWDLARANIERAQKRQKLQYDKKASAVNLQVGNRVMVYMPAKVKGKDRKIARPYHGPYWVLSLTPTNAEVRFIDDPTNEPIFVALERIRLCYPEQEGTTWTGRQKKKWKSKRTKTQGEPSLVPPSAPRSGPVTRSMTHQTK